MAKERKKNKWNKYNIRSLSVPKGKEASEYYNHLLKLYGPVRATAIYKEFRYQTTHGQRTL